MSICWGLSLTVQLRTVRDSATCYNHHMAKRTLHKKTNRGIGRKRCPSRNEKAECLYCEAPLYGKHEHDHFPIPHRSGGKTYYCVCVNCHDIKDRHAFQNWNAGDFFGSFSALWRKASPLERLSLAKMLSLISEANAMSQRLKRIRELPTKPSAGV